MDPDAHGAWLSTQVTEAHQKVVLAQNKLFEACWDAVATQEAARIVEDVIAAATDNTQDIDLQAGFKVLCQALV